MRRSTLPLCTWLAVAACAPTQESRGEIMVVVTSDLVVPTDLDRIEWSVTLEGDNKPYAGGTHDLVPEGLPATLALVSGPKTSDPVRVRLVGRYGAELDGVRVTRSARVHVPDEGVRELSMPLDFLCAVGGRSEQCDALGETCDAGECIPELVAEGALPSYETQEPLPCFDAIACISPAGDELRLGGDQPSQGPCALNGSEVSRAPDANLGLVVNTARVGNFGACRPDPAGACVVPIPGVPTGDPRGWSTPPDSSEVVELPAGVCDVLRTGAATVTIAELSSECPVFTPGTPLCPTAGTCIERPELCPKSFGPDWTGYSCSGDYPKLAGCYEAEIDRASKAEGRHCCAGSGAWNDERDPLLIDDMSFGPQLKLKAPAGFEPGFWWTSVSSPPSDAIHPEPNTLFRYREIDPPFESEDGVRIERAACLSSSKGFVGPIATEGVHLLRAPLTPGDDLLLEPLDVSAYAGIRFYAMATPFVPELEGAGPEIEVQFPNSATSRHSAEAMCPGGRDCAHFRKAVTLSDVWTEHPIYFRELEQDGDTLEEFEPRLISIEFAIHGREGEQTSQPFGFCVAQIHFLPKE